MAEQKSRTKFHVLIVEDDLALASGLCRALENEETKAVSCHTLREADILLEGKSDGMAGEERRTGFDLVILDVNLPDGNGFDYLQKAKKKYDIFVIMLTANDMETDIVTGLELGADDYITKPFSLAVLRARVSTQLRRVGAQESSHRANGTAGVTVFADGGEWIVDGDYRFCCGRSPHANTCRQNPPTSGCHRCGRGC